MPEVSGLPEPGSAVLVTGAGVTGRAILAALAPLGVRAALTDDRPAALAEYARQGVPVVDPPSKKATVLAVLAAVDRIRSSGGAGAGRSP